MEFALFYEIPVAKPWDARHPNTGPTRTRSSRRSLGDQLGFHSFWTVEHHFLEEYSHCSNPEVLYGAIAAQTENIRIGYGVRLLPKPYNHPVRTRRVGRRARPHLATAASSSAPAARRPAPSSRASTSTRTRPARCGARRSATSSARGPRTSTRPTASTGRWRASGACSRSRCRSRTRRCGARRAARTATARSVATASACARSPSACRPRSWPSVSTLYRQGISRVHPAGGQVRQRPGRHLHDGALRRHQGGGPRRRRGVVCVVREARRRASSARVGRVARGARQPVGTYEYTADAARAHRERPAFDSPDLRLPARLRLVRRRRPRRSASRRASATRRRAAICCSASSTRTTSPTRT